MHVNWLSTAAFHLTKTWKFNVFFKLLTWLKSKEWIKTFNTFIKAFIFVYCEENDQVSSKSYSDHLEVSRKRFEIACSPPHAKPTSEPINPVLEALFYLIKKHYSLVIEENGTTSSVSDWLLACKYDSINHPLPMQKKFLKYKQQDLTVLSAWAFLQKTIIRQI